MQFPSTASPLQNWNVILISGPVANKMQSFSQWSCSDSYRNNNASNALFSKPPSADTPSTPISQSPQSSSCSPFTTGYYNTPPGGQVFFPQTPSGVLPPRTPNAAGGRGGARIFFGQPTPSPSGSSSYSSSQHSANSPDASHTTTPASCSSAAPIL